MPVNNAADGTVLTASFLNTNYRDQVVSTVTSGTRPSGTEGQVIVETDTDLLQIYSGSGWVPFGGYGIWTTWTPAIVQSGSVTVTVTEAFYVKIGRLVIAEAALSVTGTGTANNVVTCSLPVTSGQANGTQVGSGFIRDSSATSTVPAIVSQLTTSTVRFMDTTVATNALFLGQTGTTMAAALASGDTIVMQAIYQSAA